ncbi:MAG TPA: alkaline phosphatase family protein, partial [Streptomyces sp.]|nr:alkaline phosphatase family protein [Streptomyces sp.]
GGGVSAARPALVVISVDGATPAFARQFGLFRSAAGRPVAALPSVYPSSTAPSHASVLTGAPPAAHGVVANRYWEHEDAAEIRGRQGALASLHPYDRASLRCPSVLDDFLERGLSVGAVLFPHTFSREVRHPALESCYCLYAPGRRWTLPWEPGAQQRASLVVRCFEEELSFRVASRGGGEALLTRGAQSWPLRLGTPADVVVPVGREKAISFCMVLDDITSHAAVLRQTTAVLVLAAGAREARDWVRGPVAAHSRSVEYTANPAHDFHESPTVEWVTQAALGLAAETPDVMFVRYNQVDHAQEFLYWQATRGDRDTAAAARRQIEAVYRRVAAGVDALREAVGAACPVVVLSDHGIDRVDTHVAPNRILADLGLASDLVFQGDSNVCYLYGKRGLSGAERAQFEQLARPARIRVLPPAELRARGAWHEGRCGTLVLESAPHTEFQYHDGDLVERVQSASHGFSPRLPAMDGIWQVLQGPELPTPASVTGVADVLRTALSRTRRQSP